MDLDGLAEICALLAEQDVLYAELDSADDAAVAGAVDRPPTEKIHDRLDEIDRELAAYVPDLLAALQHAVAPHTPASGGPSIPGRGHRDPEPRGDRP